MKLKKIVQKTGGVFCKLSLLLLVTMLTTQCSQSDDEYIADGETIYHSIQARFSAMEKSDGSRTTISSEGKIKWDAEDKIKAYIVPSGSQQFAGCEYLYETNSSDCDINKFNPVLEHSPSLVKGKPYDWYIYLYYIHDAND